MVGRKAPLRFYSRVYPNQLQIPGLSLLRVSGRLAFINRHETFTGARPERGNLEHICAHTNAIDLDSVVH